MRKGQCRCKSVSLVVYILIILFGISSWVDINGLWVELPVLVQNLPEGWDLPSYMSVIIQIANISPLVYMIISTLYPHRMLEVPVIYIIISLGGVSCLILAFLWNVTSYIGNKEHSTALFGLQFCLALVDCTSSVAYLAFMATFKPQYMTAYFIGEGFSGLIPSLIALGQGSGRMKCITTSNLQNITRNETILSKNVLVVNNKFNYTVNTSGNVGIGDLNWTRSDTRFTSFPVYQEPRFSVRIFFLLLMVLMILSLISFTLLNNWSYCRKEHAKESEDLSSKIWPMANIDSSGKATIEDNREGNNPKLSEVLDYKENVKNCEYNNDQNNKLLNGDAASKDLTSGFKDLCKMPPAAPKVQERILTNEQMSPVKYISFLLLTVLLNFISNGLLPSIQTYSCLPYGVLEYHLSVTLSTIANPVACVVAFFHKMKSVMWTVAMTLTATALTGYIVWTASTSPDPPLVHHQAGSIVLILSWILVVFVLSYTKVSIATEFREEGKKALLWLGASTQAGSLLGAILIFLIVNVFKIFRAANHCV